MKHFFLLFVFLWSWSSFAYRPGSSDTSIYNECLWNQEALEIDVECNDVFNHYQAKSFDYDPKSNVRLGSYNIFRSSQERNKKNLELTAQMIDSEWDVVALSELQPGSTTDIKHFADTDEYILPAYLRILNHLQDLDSSWALIVSPYSQGADSEIFGFLYRANQVKAVQSDYCQTEYVDNAPFTNNFIYRELTKDEGITSRRSGDVINERDFIKPSKAIACPLSLKGLYQEQFTKVPLTARFVSGDFEFSYLSLHLSFRSFGEANADCLGTCSLNVLKLISALSGTDDNPIVSQINQFSSKTASRNLIEAIDLILPKSCAKFDIEANDTTEREKQIKKFNSCKEKFANFFETLEAYNFSAPDSCTKFKNRQETESEYDQCDDDWDAFKDSGLEKIMEQAVSIINEQLNSNFNFPESVASIYADILKDGLVSKGEGRELNRFFQAFTATRAASEIIKAENQNDVIIGGDFNLEIEANQNHWRAKAWQLALGNLPGADLLITEKTSLNSSREHSKNYDHFILVNDSGQTDECDVSTAHALDFVNPNLVLESGLELGQLVTQEEYAFALSDHLPIGMTCQAL